MKNITPYKENILLEFAERLKIALERTSGEFGVTYGERGWIQCVAREFQVTHTAVCKWLNAEMMPDMKNLTRIAKRCNVSINWLATGQGDIDITDLSNDEKNMIIRYRRADSRGKATIRSVAESQANYSPS